MNGLKKETSTPPQDDPEELKCQLEQLKLKTGYLENEIMVLKESEKHFQMVARAATDAIMTLDERGVILYSNPATFKIFGYSAEELQGQPITMLMPEYLRRVHQASLERYLATGVRHLNWEAVSVPGLHRYGHEIMLEISFGEIRHNGKVLFTGIIRDVTARNQIEQKYRESEARFRAIVEGSPVPLFISSFPEGEILFANHPAKQTVGLEEEQVSKKFNFSHFCFNQDDLSALIEGIKTQRFVNFQEIQIKRLDGTALWVTISLKLSNFSGQEVMLGAFYDVTQRKLAQDQLKTSEERFRNLTVNSPDFIYILDLVNQTSLYFNRTELMGYTKEELTRPGSIFYTVHPQDKEAVSRHWREVMEGQNNLIEYRMQRKDGQWEWVQSRETSLAFDEVTGRPTQVLVTLSPITARKQTEEALAAEKDRLAVTMRSIGEGVITIDCDGRIQLVNRAAEVMTGWSQTEATGLMLEQVFRLVDNRNSQDTTGDFFRQTLQAEHPVELPENIYLIDRYGVRVAIGGNAAPIHDQRFNGNSDHPAASVEWASGPWTRSVRGLVIVFRDETEKQRQLEERHKATKLESLGVLAGGIAHDFNNILTAIIGNISLAGMYMQGENELEASVDSGQPSALSPEVRQALQTLQDAEKACIRARELTQQLLTFSKGGAPIKQTARLGEVIEDTARFVLHGSNVQGYFDLPPDLWAVEVDKGQISQVIHNLVLNALQAMPEGGQVWLRGRNRQIYPELVPFVIPRTGKFLSIEVQDTGVGIPAEHLSRIFDPYFTTKNLGNGLGLATAYSIIERHDGHLVVDSQPGVGTTFTIYLPASPGAVTGGLAGAGLFPSRATTPARPPVRTGQTGQIHSGVKGKLLVMEDEPAVRAMLARLLERSGYQIELYPEGKLALEAFENAQETGQPFDVVITDLTIPGGMGGKELLEQLKKVDPGVKVIVVSGYSQEQILSNYLELGFQGIVAKPFKIQELLKVIQGLLTTI